MGREDLPRIAYVNGRYLRLGDARVHVEDRGFQFADGVYEVAAVLNHRLFDWEPHLARLARSLGELAMSPPLGPVALGMIARRLIAVNAVNDGLLYIEVTRGVARRDHAFPAAGTRPTLVMTLRPFDFAAKRCAVEKGVAVALVPDERWARPDIKSVSLLPNVLAKEAARAAGAAEAWMVRDGFVTEGGSTNAWIVTSDGAVVTRAADRSILRGVMRDTLLRLGAARVEERAFTPAEAKGAAEAFITSTTNPCVPVVRVDGVAVGDGKPGPVTRRMAAAMWAEIERQTGWRSPD